MPMRSETLFGATLWRPVLEKFSAVIPMTIELYDNAGVRASWGPTAPTPLFELFAEHGWDPGLFAECAKLCLGQDAAGRAVQVTQAHGLAVVGTAFVLGGEIVGAAVGGYVLVDFPQATALQRLARTAGLPFSRIWQVARAQGPVSNRRLGHYGELLQVLGDALLRENERTRQVEETADHLSKAAAAKDEFLAILSHELRAPLAPILTWSNLLKTGAVDAATVQRAASVIARNALLQVRLIEDLLDLNRITLGKVTLDFRVHDLQEELASAVEAIVDEAQAKGAQLEVKKGEPLPVEGDTGRLQQIFHNLLSNALKFTPTGGRIFVTAARDAEEAVVEIRDSGEGIAPEFLPFVFEMFRQQEQGTRRVYPGLGIGLAVVKGLTELHGGVIAIASEGKGCGTTVTFRLPLASGGAAEASVDATGSVPAPFEGLTILIVEDMVDTREATQRLVERLGAEVLLACDGQEALEAVARASPDLVLCDLRMPRMDGFEFIEALRHGPGDGATLPVIAVSGLTTRSDREKTRKAGFQDHLSKPFDDDSLVAAVGVALRQKFPLELA